MSSRRPKIQLHPVNWVQRLALYKTHSKFYLIGTNNTQTSFKVLKIDRTEDQLSFVDDRIEYSYQEIRDLLMRLEYGNPTQPSKSAGLTKIVSSFGLIGFVKFLHGYYLILITRRRKVAMIGYHTIYTVEDTELVYIPNQEPTDYVAEETHYRKEFCSIDLKTNFYYSYSYDISHTLQYNLAPIRNARFFQDQRRASQLPELSADISDQRSMSFTHEAAQIKLNKNHQGPILVKTKTCDRFVWNSHLIDFDGLHDDWKVTLVHGFVKQANICVYSKPIYITLIARRSRRYCGTRFLKRGLNLDGDVANEVESEQIVHDSSVSDFSHGFFTSFVQMRGSLPDRWSQDATKIVPKPTIMQDFVDPYHEAPAKHFNNLLRRYGSPTIVLNLIKQKEKKPHESVLRGMLQQSVEYLNQFLPQHHVIKLINFDMARCNKSTKGNVMNRLGKIGFNIVRVTGIFQSWRSARKSNYDNTYTLHLRQRTFNREPSSSKIGGYRLRNGQCLQNGIVRVNCVDSLDRTNTAQFVLGKVALAFQLQALGVLIEPSLEYDTDAVRLLERLYEEHGDAIALQYGGSQLVHRVKTYRKVAPITSFTNSIRQTLTRYFSNTFSDAEKQNVMNIFLGIQKPQQINILEILNIPITDYYLHNRVLMKPFYLDRCNKSETYKQWWDRRLLKSLPRAYDEYEKEMTCYALEVRASSPTLPLRIDYFLDGYRPYELTYLPRPSSGQILHTITDFMPLGALDYSPFCLRLEPGKLEERNLRMRSDRKLISNQTLHGHSSTSSDSSDLSLLGSEVSDDNDSEALTSANVSQINSIFSPNTGTLIKKKLLSDITITRQNIEDLDFALSTDIAIEYYGCVDIPLSVHDFEMYRLYVDIGKTSCKQSEPSDLMANNIDKTAFYSLTSLLPEIDTSVQAPSDTGLVPIIPTQTDLALFASYIVGTTLH